MENVSRAAERLAIRQSSLSAAIKRLEGAVGADLLVRSRVGVKLTKAGELFRQSSQEIVERWEALRATTKHATTEIAGRFTIGCHPTIARYALPLFLPALASRHPALQFELVHERSHVLTEMVISSRLDFAIVSFERDHPDLVVTSFGRDIVGIFAHPEVEVDPATTVLLVDPDVKGYEDLLQALAKKRLRFLHQLSSSSVETLRALAEARYGAVILPRNTVVHAKPASPLILRREYPVTSYDLRFIHRADTQGTAAAREIARFIRKRCEPLRNGSVRSVG
jgi:DNA-binding transcriptional LysR family regulator